MALKEYTQKSTATQEPSLPDGFPRLPPTLQQRWPEEAEDYHKAADRFWAKVRAAMVNTNEEIVRDTMAIITGDLMSDTYVPGAAGWKLGRSAGDAEFSKVTIRDALVLWSAATPVLSQGSSTFTTPLTITATVTGGSTIRYTIDGTEVTSASAVFPGGGLAISVTTTLRVRAIHPDTGIISKEVTAQYTLGGANGTNGTNGATGGNFTPSLTNVTDLGGGSFKKTGGTGGTYDGQVYSAEAFTGGAYCSFKAAQTNKAFVVGLNTDPVSNSATDIDYGWHCNAAGSSIIYEAGTAVAYPGAYTTATIFSITYDGMKVRYFMDGVLQFTSSSSTVVPGLKLYLDSAFSDANGQADAVRFGPQSGASSPGYTLINGLGCSFPSASGIKRQAGGGGTNGTWDAGAYSREGWVGGAYLSFRAKDSGSQFAMLGMGEDQTADNSYGSIDYAWYTKGDDHTCYVYENGSGTIFGAWDGNTVFSIVYDGSTIKYYKDAVLMKTTNASSASLKLYLDSSFLYQDAEFNSIAFGPQGSTAASYLLILSAAAINQNISGVFNPTTLTATAVRTFGTAAPAAYSGRYKIYENGSGSPSYTSSADEASKTYTPSGTGVTSIKVELYLAGGTTALLDSYTVPVTKDGSNGANGANGANGVAVNGTLTTSSTQTISGATATSILLTLTTGTLANVLFSGVFTNNTGGSSTFGVLLYIDGSQVAGFNTPSISNGGTAQINIVYTPSLSAGSHTFKMYVTGAPGSSTLQGTLTVQ